MSLELLEKPELDGKLFEKYRDIIYKRSGIALNEGKIMLVQSRLAKRLKLLGLKDYKEYYDFLMGDESGDELSNFIDVISTNVTHFYREAEHLNLLEKMVGEPGLFLKTPGGKVISNPFVIYAPGPDVTPFNHPF